MKKAKISEVQYLSFRNFGITVKEKDAEKFIDELEEICEKCAIDGNEYFFNFKGE